MNARLRLSILIPCLFLTVTACGGGPTPSDAYLAYRKAFDAARSLDDLLPYMAKETRAKMEAAPADEKKMGFEFMKGTNDYLDLAVVNATVTGADATVVVTATSTFGSDARGTIEMVKEEDAWKIKKESWSDEKAAEGAPTPTCAQLATDLKSDKASVRARAAGALAQRTCPEAIAALADTLKDAREGIRANAAAGLRTTFSDGEHANANKSVMPLILAAKAEAARNDEVTIEISLQWALSAFGAEAVPHLVEDLKHKSRDMRWGAAANLGRLGADAKNALPALEARAKEEADATVRDRMTEAVTQIRGGD